jgi:hypothetical protein
LLGFRINDYGCHRTRRCDYRYTDNLCTGRGYLCTESDNLCYTGRRYNRTESDYRYTDNLRYTGSGYLCTGRGDLCTESEECYTEKGGGGAGSDYSGGGSDTRFRDDSDCGR